jgi:hypothetical protein
MFPLLRARHLVPVVATLVALAAACRGGPPLGPRHPKLAAAIELLSHASRLESTHIGVGGTPSEYAEALRVVRDSPDAAVMFRELADNASTAGRLYGLIGLYLTARDQVDAAADRVIADGGTIVTQGGCIGGEAQVAEIVRSPRPGGCDIVSGCIPQQFALH